MLRSILIQLASEAGTSGFLAVAVTFGLLILLNGWMAVETYLRGRRDGRREALRVKSVVEPLEWDSIGPLPGEADEYH